MDIIPSNPQNVCIHPELEVLQIRSQQLPHDQHIAADAFDTTPCTPQCCWCRCRAKTGLLIGNCWLLFLGLTNLFSASNASSFLYQEEDEEDPNPLIAGKKKIFRFIRMFYMMACIVTAIIGWRGLKTKNARTLYAAKVSLLILIALEYVNVLFELYLIIGHHEGSLGPLIFSVPTMTLLLLMSGANQRLITSVSV